jgi:hypothetical protein
MMTIVRDRIQAMVEKGMTLAQMKAAAPAKDDDPLHPNSATLLGRLKPAPASEDRT